MTQAIVKERAEWVRVPELARRWGLAPASVWYHVHLGRVPHRHSIEGGRRCVRVKALEKPRKLRWGVVSHGEVKPVECAACSKEKRR